MADKQKEEGAGENAENTPPKESAAAESPTNEGAKAAAPVKKKNDKGRCFLNRLQGNIYLK